MALHCRSPIFWCDSRSRPHGADASLFRALCKFVQCRATQKYSDAKARAGSCRRRRRSTIGDRRAYLPPRLRLQLLQSVDAEGIAEKVYRQLSFTIDDIEAERLMGRWFVVVDSPGLHAERCVVADCKQPRRSIARRCWPKKLFRRALFSQNAIQIEIHGNFLGCFLLTQHRRRAARFLWPRREARARRRQHFSPQRPPTRREFFLLSATSPTKSSWPRILGLSM